MIRFAILLLALVAADARRAPRDPQPTCDGRPATGDSPQDLASQIDELLSKSIDPDGPGAAVLVLKDGKPLHKKGYGFANIEHRVPVTVDTVFEMASVSKQFTAMAVLILADRGKLALDDDARKTLPELPEYDPKRPIRVRDLLHQVSGLKDYLGLLGKVKGDPDRLTNEGALKLLAEEKLAFPTGTRWQYSNSNYLLLSLVIERVSGRKFSEFVRAEIYEPLGMKSSHVFDDPKAVIRNRAYGYSGTTKRGWRTSHSDLAVTGDGGIMTSLEDMARWDAGLREGRLVKPETLKLAFTKGKLDDGREHAYGFGWAIGRHLDRPLFSHSGGWYGAATYIGRYVDDRVTVVVFSNWDRFDPERAGRQIAAIVLPAKKEYR